MNGILADLRDSLRTVSRRPGFSALVVLTLAIGIGASTAIFSVVDGVLLRDLPYPEADRLIRVRTHFRGRVTSSSAAANFLDYREQIQSLESVTAYNYRRWHLGEAPEPRFLLGVVVSHEIFDVIGVRPALGRGLSVEDERPDANVAVISHSLWQGHFAGRPDVIGRPLILDSESYTVVGVMPPGFDFPYYEVEVWRPLWLDVSDPGLRTDHIYGVVARVADGSSIAEAQSELVAYGERVIRQFPENYKTFQYGVSAVSLHEWVTGDARPSLLVLLAAVTCMLLIACANVANLLLVRSESRTHELAVRSALGASSGRIARHVLVECLLLAIGGGAIGLLLTLLGLPALLALAGDAVPRADSVQIDIRVLAFTVGVSILAGLLAGVLPAIRISGQQPNQTLHAGGRAVIAGGRSTMRRALVVVEVALAVVLVIGAGLMFRTLANLHRAEVGFRTDNVLTALIELPPGQYREPAGVVAFYRTLVERVQAMPGVESAGLVWRLPLASGLGGYSIQIEGSEVETIGEAPTAHLQLASPGLFPALDLSPTSGRLLEGADTFGRPYVAVVNESFVNEILDGGPAVGQRVKLWGDESPWLEIVGVVPDIRHLELEGFTGPTMYGAHAQTALPPELADLFIAREARNMVLVAHAEPDAGALAAPIRALLRELDPTVPVSDIRTMSDVRASAAAHREFPTMLLVGFGIVAMALATVGVYAVVAFSASRRTHEIGVRMAVGAEAAEIRRMVVWDGLVPVVLGVLLGLAGAIAASRVLGSLLYNVRPTDPLTLAVVPALIAATALVASYIPAFRASRVDPANVLRSE
jgi:putative ABC transport system permease protein